MDLAALSRAYREDGVVVVPRALGREALAQAHAAYDWSLAHPGPLRDEVRAAQTDATFYNDLYNPGVRRGLSRDAGSLAAAEVRSPASGARLMCGSCTSRCS